MERIKLSKKEKALLRNIASGVSYPPDNMSIEVISCTASFLERRGLIVVVWASGHEFVSARLTNYGIAYLQENSKLNNPINWYQIITTIIQVGILIATTAAIFTGCVLAKRAQWKFSGDKHKSLQVDTERTFHQRYPLVML